jgi:hypothetical protein
MDLPDSLDELDREIGLLEARLIALKRKRNSKISLCSLPDEILVFIIKAVYMTRPDDENISDFSMVHDFYDFNYSRNWLKLTYTCTRIRNLAIITPEFWTFIDLEFHPIELHVARAKSALLTLNIEKTSVNRAVYGLPHIGQTKAVRVSMMPSEVMQPLLDNASPHLTTFHVSHIHDEEELEALNRLGPQLEELYLLDSEIDYWPTDITPWNNMRRVRLEDIFGEANIIPLLLSQMQGLETLSIINQEGLESLDVEPASDTIINTGPSLTCLRRLTIHVGPSPTLVLLQSIAAMRRSTQGVILDIIPLTELWTVATDFSDIVDHLMDQWGTAWAKSQTTASLVWRHDTPLLVSITSGNEVGSQSILQVPYSDITATASIYRNHGLVFTSLEVLGQSMDPRMINRMNAMAVEHGPQLNHIKFDGVSGTRQIRTWFESRGPDTSHIKNITVVNSKDDIASGHNDSGHSSAHEEFELSDDDEEDVDSENDSEQKSDEVE